MATKRSKCSDAEWGVSTIAGVTHCSPICASAVAAGGSTEGLTRCARWGAVGDQGNGYCAARRWWS
jgi:hypothetical protein